MKTTTLLMMGLVAMSATATVIAANVPAVQPGRTLTVVESSRLLGGGNDKCCGDDPACNPAAGKGPCNGNNMAACPTAKYQYNPSAGVGRRCTVPAVGKNCNENDPNNNDCLVEADCKWDMQAMACVFNSEVVPVSITHRWDCNDNCGIIDP